MNPDNPVGNKCGILRYGIRIPQSLLHFIILKNKELEIFFLNLEELVSASLAIMHCTESLRA